MITLLYKILSHNNESKEYRKVNKVNLYKLLNDKGIYGEYLTYNILKDLGGKVISNLYLPKLKNGTTEIDMVLINPKGIFVIESKNYSGRIYGSTNSKYWMQILGNNQRNKFYSPIFQNNTHINALKNILKDVNVRDIYSIIVFSERCNIDRVDVTSDNVKVIKRNQLKSTINEIIDSDYIKYINEEIEDIYEILIKYTNVSQKEKEQHIENITKNYS